MNFSKKKRILLLWKVDMKIIFIFQQNIMRSIKFDILISDEKISETEE